MKRLMFVLGAAFLFFGEFGFANGTVDAVTIKCKVVETQRNDFAHQKITWVNVKTHDHIAPDKLDSKLVKGFHIEIYIAGGSNRGNMRFQTAVRIMDKKSGEKAFTSSQGDSPNTSGKANLLDILTRSNGDAVAVWCGL